MSNIIDNLKEYDKLYYEHGKPVVSDEYYDSMKDIAREKYPDEPYFQEVGFPTRDKVKLPYILGSLNKVKENTVDKWIREHPGEYVISQKMDGVSILVIYENGSVQKAYKRGDGEYGRDITDKASIFCPKINNDSIMILRGEAMLTGDIYKTLGFSTARNGVAGILNREENDDVKYIKPYFYECIKFGDLNTYTEYERFVLIESLGLKTPLWKLIEKFSMEEILSLNAEISDYKTDGVVIALNNSERENVKFPKNKVAYKLVGEKVQSTVVDVEWNVSRNGRLIPVVVMEPVSIDEVTISRASGFNAHFISSNHISKGTVIEIIRSNDVIPYITKVISTLDYEPMPTECPSCGGRLQVKGDDLVCNNNACISRSLKQVEYFLRTLGAENITDKTLDKLGIWNIERAYEITDIEIMSHSSFGPRSAQIIIGEIKKTLKTTQAKLLQAFGIPGVGAEISKSLLKCFGDIENIFDASEDDLMECEGVGPKISENIIKESYNCYMLYKYLQNLGLKFVEGGDINMLKGKQFTLTGKGPMSRDELSNIIESKGGVVKGISKTTNYLVTSDMSSTSGKMKKANEYGVDIISYEQLMEMLDI
jgi:DNA ligase (NAD+)